MTIEDLRTYGILRRNIQTREEMLARMRSLAEKTTQMLSQAPVHSGEADKLAAQVAAIIDFETEIIEEKLNLERRLLQIDKWLSTLPEQQGRVMRLRYVDELSWDDVAEQAPYSRRHCTKIHKAAVERMR